MTRKGNFSKALHRHFVLLVLKNSDFLRKEVQSKIILLRLQKTMLEGLEEEEKLFESEFFVEVCFV